MRLATTLITLSTGLAAPNLAQECVDSIRDQAGGDCLEASSVPEGGKIRIYSGKTVCPKD